MRTKVITDSTCDLSPELIQQFDITVVPLTIVMGGKPYKDTLEVTPEDIAAHVNGGGDLPTTSAVSVGEFSDCFSQYAGDYDHLIVITIGSGFSACYQNASIAAEDFSNVLVFDSANLTTGQGRLAIEAALEAQQGTPAPEIIQKLEQYRTQLETSFVMESLDYMKKGGRCSSVLALGANLLKLRPCIDVINGQMQVTKKYRGSFEKVVMEYVHDRLRDREDLDLRRIFISYQANEQLARQVEEAIRQHHPFAEINYTKLGCTVFSHSGPNTLGILFMRKA